MPAPEISVAEYLRSARRTTTAEDAARAADWDGDAIELVSDSLLRSTAAASAEAARQLALYGQPLALEELVLAGLHFDLIGRWLEASRPDSAERRRLYVVKSTVSLRDHQTIVEGYTPL